MAKKRVERRFGNSTADVSGYVRVKTAAGRASLDSNDAVARELRGVALDAVYRRAAELLKRVGKEPGRVSSIEAELRRRYGKLNAGLQRMSLGNRIRGAANWQRGANK